MDLVVGRNGWKIMKTIVVDWNGTFTEFADLLLPFMLKAKEAGHRVIICTMRYPEEGDDLRSVSHTFEIIYTSRQAKVPYLMSKDIYPDLWIDDNPLWLYIDSKDINNEEIQNNLTTLPPKC